MPYRSITELPEIVKNNLPIRAQEIFKDAYNTAEKAYEDTKKATEAGWDAVKDKFEEVKDKWIEKH